MKKSGLLDHIKSIEKVNPNVPMKQSLSCCSTISTLHKIADREKNGNSKNSMFCNCIAE